MSFSIDTGLKQARYNNPDRIVSSIEESFNLDSHAFEQHITGINLSQSIDYLDIDIDDLNCGNFRLKQVVGKTALNVPGHEIPCCHGCKYFLRNK